MESVSEKEPIDEIMEEMEAATPKASDKLKTFEMFQLETDERAPESVDARRVESSTFFSSILKKSVPKPGLSHPSKPTEDRYYDFTNTSVGIALIFNQVKVKGEQERGGSEKDAEDLRKVLAEIGFAVEICTDFSTKQIHEMLTAGKSSCSFYFTKILSESLIT